MDFYQLDERYKMLAELVRDGTLSQDDFREQVGKLQVEDENGNIWTRAPHSGRWVKWDGNAWQAATPPAFEQPVEDGGIPPIPADLDATDAPVFDSPAAVIPDPVRPSASSTRIMSSKSGSGVVSGASSRSMTAQKSSSTAGADRLRAKARQGDGPAQLGDTTAKAKKNRYGAAEADAPAPSGWLAKTIITSVLIWGAVIVIGSIIAITADMDEWYFLSLGLCLAAAISFIVTIVQKSSAWEGTVEDIRTVTSTDDEGDTTSTTYAYVRLVTGKRKRVRLMPGWYVGIHLKKVQGENVPRIMN